MAQDSNNKVKLQSAGNGLRVTFRASPTVTENRNVNYNALEPLHAPGQIQVYKNTSSRSFSVSDLKLISRTTKEADDNLKTLWRLRAWTMPRFGNSSTLSNPQRLKREIGEESFADTEYRLGTKSARSIHGVELLGAPPEVLYLSVYSHDVGSDGTSGKPGTFDWIVAQHINKVPVVIQQLTIPYPNDIDYINTSKGVPMPIIMNIDLQLLETHSPNAYEKFSLDNFRTGTLTGF